MKTKTSDQGWTNLRGGARVRKDHQSLAVGGDIDELNSLMGAALALLEEGRASAKVRRPLEKAQLALLAAGCALAGAERAGREQTALLAAATLALESSQRRLSKDLPPLHGFVIPGGSPAGAWLHVARAVCRRAERGAVALSRHGAMPEGLLALLNRLSSWLFAAARRVNAGQGRPGLSPKML